MLSATGGHGDFPLLDGADVSERLRALDPRTAVADGPDAVTRTVRELIRDGAQVIKVAATGGISTPADGPDDVGFSVPELRAAVAAADGRGRPVAAHAIGTRGIAAAVAAGVRSIEHGYGLTAELAAGMAERGTFLVPTLAALDQAGDAAVVGHETREKARVWQEAAITSVRMAVEAGVRIAVGTDAGIGIHHAENLKELAHLAEAGLSPMDAIVAGTRTAADVCDLGDQVGTLEPGKRADLVIAAGNPLDDIGLLGDARNITLVVQDGHIVKHTSESIAD